MSMSNFNGNLEASTNIRVTEFMEKLETLNGDDVLENDKTNTIKQNISIKHSLTLCTNILKKRQFR